MRYTFNYQCSLVWSREGTRIPCVLCQGQHPVWKSAKSKHESYLLWLSLVNKEAANSSLYCVTLNTVSAVFSRGIASGQSWSCNYPSLHKRAADLCCIPWNEHACQFSVYSCFALTTFRGSWFNFLILVHCGQPCKLGSVSLLILHLADVCLLVVCCVNLRLTNKAFSCGLTKLHSL